MRYLKISYHFVPDSATRKSTEIPKTTSAKNKETSKVKDDESQTFTTAGTTKPTVSSQTTRVHNINFAATLKTAYKALMTEVISTTARVATDVNQKAIKSRKLANTTTKKIGNNKVKKGINDSKVVINSTSGGLHGNKSTKPGERVVGGVNLVDTNSSAFSKNLNTNCLKTKSRPAFMIWYVTRTFASLLTLQVNQS